MKKLFFTALVAVVAVGGALASGTYEDALSNTIVCDTPITPTTCISVDPLYEVGHAGDPDFLIPESAYQNEYKQN